MTRTTDISALRARLEGTRGREYWRSLEALSETPEFEAFLHREFPEHASEWLDPVGRRGFLKLMGASLALAGITACTRQPDERIVPYVRQPEEIVPGKPLFYATAMPLSGSGLGLLVETHEGRPTKIEGNPDHPSSRGATDVFAQAAILDLYDPDRSQTLSNLGEIRPFGAFIGAMRTVVNAQQAKQGSGIRLLTETVASPTLAAQIDELVTRFPQAKWIQWEPVGRHQAREGSRLAFGDYVDAQYTIEKADVIFSIDADFLCNGPGGVRHARAFASRRRIEGDASQMNRLYAIESTPTNTGTKADHRLPLRASQIEAVARAVAAGLGIPGVTGNPPQAAARWIAPLVKDLQAHRGRSLVIPGDAQPAVVHALAHAMNQALGNVGATVVYTQTAEARPTNQFTALADLVGEMNAGTVDLLLILGTNPVYSAPRDLKFGDALQRVPLRAHLGLYEDETAALCQWHIPQAHFLEAWSDVRSADGTATIVQPMIAPLYQGRSAHEVIATLSDRPERPGYELVREYWAKQSGLPIKAPAPPTPPAVTGDRAKPGSPAPIAPAPAKLMSPFDKAWRRWLHDGSIPNTAFASKPVSVRAGFAEAPAGGGRSGAAAGQAEANDTLEVVFQPDPSIYDGRFANNGWLQELPKPLTKLTWDNAALISPATAERLRLVSGDFVDVVHGDRTLRIPVWIAPGHAADSLTLHLGYGRTRAGRVGNGAGFDANLIRTSDAPWGGRGLEVSRTGESRVLACTQDHWSIDVQAEERHVIRPVTVDEYAKEPEVVKEQTEVPPRDMTLYPNFKYPGHAWGMSIDLNSCVGCGACVVACVAENNIPGVGRDQVHKGREMHWLRIDRYFSGQPERSETITAHFQPLPCQQCENAPCEQVCPVAATVHSDEGLNDQVYNRCIGTRYCSNNCPYKVRRFNFFLYQDWNTPTLKLQRNPDVSVRSRGVMEKCTYCVQRIEQARITAHNQGREIRDGEIQTACQSACPGEAIVFGDVNDPTSRVSRLKSQHRDYSLLGEINTRPRTTYLAEVKNPNPEIPAAAGTEGSEHHG